MIAKHQLFESSSARVSGAHRLGRAVTPALIAAMLSLSGSAGAQYKAVHVAKNDVYSAMKPEEGKTAEQPAKETAPELAAGCPIPTLAECQADGYLTGETGGECGLRQGEEPEWTCAQLLQALADGYPTERGVMARNIKANGVVADVAHVEQDDADQGLNATADPLHLGSQYYADTFVGSVVTTYAAPGGGFLAAPAVGPATQAASTSLAARDTWDENEERFASCQEYAFEQYYDVNVFWREVGADRHNYHRTFELAFSDDSNDFAIGTHRQGSLQEQVLDFRDKEGNGVLPSVFFGPRNHFFDLQPESENFGGTFAKAAGPNLLSSMSQYSVFGAEVAEQINANREDGEKELADFEVYFRKMSVEGRPQVANVPPALGVKGESTAAGGSGYTAVGGGTGTGFEPGTTAWTDHQQADDAAAITGMIPPSFVDGKPLRRLFLQEFDELYDLQMERNRLVEEWAELNRRFGFNWRISDLLEALGQDEGGEDDDEGPQVGYEMVPGGGYTNNNIWRAPGGGDTSGGGQSGSAAGGSTLKPVSDEVLLGVENAARKSVLDALLAIYTIADTYGCLDAGVTYCEFSLKEFAQERIGHATTETQTAFEECLEYLPSPFQAHDHAQRLFVNGRHDVAGTRPEPWSKAEAAASPATHAEYLLLDAEFLRLHDARCVVQILLPMTPTTYNDMVEQTATCEAMAKTHQADVAAFKIKVEEVDEANAVLARVMAIPELFDPATGEVKTPGIGSAYENEVGGKWFGFDVGYDYKFESTLPGDDGDVCDFTFSAGGAFHADAKVLGYTQPLIAAHAWVHTIDEEITAGATAFGVPLFAGDAWDDDSTDTQFVARLSFASGGRSLTMAEYTQHFMIGPVPLSLGVGAAGEVGYDTAVEAKFDLLTDAQPCPQASVDATLRPYLGVNGFIELALDVVIAKAGVRGEVTIFQVAIPVKLKAGGVSSLSASTGPDVQLAVTLDARAEMTTLAGNVSVFAKVGVGGLSKSFSKEIVSWDGLSWDKSLFTQSYDVSVGDLMFARAQ